MITKPKTSASALLLGVLLLLGAVACSRPHEPAHPVHVPAAERGTAFVGRAAAAEPLLEVPLLAFRVADDDGGRPARIDAAQIAQSVAFANDVYRPAGVRFRFEPRDLLPLRRSLINNLLGEEQADWLDAKRAGDEIAARYPDRLVVFFRHGPGPNAIGRGFSWTDYNFVIMPGWPDDRHCGHDHISALAHELGHQLGLHHTFVRVFEEQSQAVAFLGQRGGDVRAFDGDGLIDTAPDPALLSTECLDYEQLELSGVSVPLPRRNIMSYYDRPDSLSAEQIARVRWFVRERRAHRMKLPKNQPAAAGETAREAERLQIVAESGGHCESQAMDRLGAGNWSAGSQLFCRSSGGPQAVRVTLPVDRAGLQRLELYVARAPDYGVLEVFLDGRPLGKPYDAWAPAVLASGAIDLGQRWLEAGNHELDFVVRAKNRASSHFYLGIDAIVLLPIEPAS